MMTPSQTEETVMLGVAAEFATIPATLHSRNIEYCRSIFANAQRKRIIGVSKMAGLCCYKRKWCFVGKAGIILPIFAHEGIKEEVKEMRLK